MSVVLFNYIFVFILTIVLLSPIAHHHHHHRCISVSCSSGIICILLLWYWRCFESYFLCNSRSSIIHILVFKYVIASTSSIAQRCRCVRWIQGRLSCVSSRSLAFIISVFVVLISEFVFFHSRIGLLPFTHATGWRRRTFCLVMVLSMIFD